MKTKTRIKTKSRKPTYSASSRILHLYRLLTQRSRVKKEYLLEKLKISSRTLERYQKTVKESLFLSDDEEQIVIQRDDGEEYWQLQRPDVISSSHYNLMSVYMGSLVMKFLDDTVLHDGIREAYSRFEEGLNSNEKQLLQNFETKFYHTSVGAKRYAEANEQIDPIFRALIKERKMVITYTSQNGTSNLVVHPYSLVIHNNALYLVGFSEKHNQIRMFSVEKIQKTELNQETFDYPEDYSPSTLFGKSFGVFIGDSDKRYEVELECNEVLYDFIANRQWMPGQKVTKPKKGKFLFKTTVNDLFEISHWVLSMGSDIKVIGPEVLREWVMTETDIIRGFY